ncbi:hypothetical protein [Yersinia enterocolitica]|uniref:hypothetical protein n=1 Tax=Yersinia enterocolitica TaxID=630 RepID=UPI002AC5B093|nr:hypothetical protein [Yersinia enterocolitica]
MSDDKKLIELANFERETQLRRLWAKGTRKITPLQQTWTRYMLMNWGAKYRGKEGPASSAGNIIGRMMWCNEWNSEQGERIKVIFTNLLNQGYMGNDLIRKVKEIFLPNSSGSSAISLAKEQDDAEFVEKIINKTLSTHSPLREVVIRHYLDCKVPQVISEKLTELTGMELESSRRRVRWAENAAEDLLFAAMQMEMENEKLQMAA